MKTLSWNCRGLGNQTTVRALRKILTSEGPNIIFLMETRLFSQQMQHLNQVKFKMADCLPVDCSGEGRKRKGGLCILWDEEVDFELITFSTNHILGRITSKGQHDSWIFSGIYGWPENTNKWRTWALMEQIKRDANEAWMCCGDFNEIFWSHEKSGGSIRSINQMNLFRETAGKCLLRDLSFIGNKFTWSNGRKGEENIQERLDRAMANDNWRDIFPEHQVRHLCRVCSDHTPILVCFDTEVTDEDKRVGDAEGFGSRTCVCNILNFKV